jgi:uncharacterized membrane protein HdeD (DUF308 family)
MSLFVPVGIVAALAGVAMVVIAIRNRGDGEDPRTNALLIGGTMLTAFGLVIAGFAIVYQQSAPIALNAAVPTP